MQLDEQIQQHVDLLPIALKEQVLNFVLFLEYKQANKITVVSESANLEERKPSC